MSEEFVQSMRATEVAEASVVKKSTKKSGKIGNKRGTALRRLRRIPNIWKQAAISGFLRISRWKGIRRCFSKIRMR